MTKPRKKAQKMKLSMYILECTEEPQEDCITSNESTSKGNQGAQLLTQLGKTLAKVLGSTTDLITLDATRHALKSKPNSPNKQQLVKQHKQLTAKIHHSLLATKIGKKKQIKALEQAYYIEHNMIPKKQ